MGLYWDDSDHAPRGGNPVRAALIILCIEAAVIAAACWGWP